MESLVASRRQSWLSWFLKGILLFGFLVMTARLFELQIIRGAYYTNLADSNRIRRVPIVAPRGQILARGGEVLVGNTEIKRTVKFDPMSGYEKVPITDDTSEEDIIIEWEREYPLGEVFSHVGGYLSEVNESEVFKVDPDCIEKGASSFGTLTGRSGLESQYDCLLRGINGEELVEVDTRGNKVRLLGRKNPIPGNDLRTTIDIKLQEKTAEAFYGEDDNGNTFDIRGGVVITDIKGEILAMYSAPTFSPYDISKAVSDKSLPLFNRAISAVYPPGSVYKLVSGIAALETDAIGKDYTYVDNGFIRANEAIYNNWYFTQYGGTEGEIDIVRAMARSTDTFFYKIAELTGVEEIVKWSEKFGLGKITNIDLPGEAAGLFPSPSWKKALKGERWYLGDTYNISIGQGDIATSPLQVNQATAVIASNGKLCRPHISADINESCRDLNISRENINLIKQGMLEACAAKGTAYPFFDFTPPTACKTGTAETIGEDVTHAWFVAYAPADFPEIVISVLNEEGGGGSSDAAPIAKRIFDYYFNP